METPQEFLNHEFQKRRQRNPNFSLRAFAKWLGTSPAQLSQVLTGKRPLSLKLMKKIGDRLELSPTEKKTLFGSLLENRQFVETSKQKKILKLQEDQFHLIADWYHFAILGLTRLPGSKSDPRWVSRRLGISLEEANQALLRLERLGILQFKPQFKQIGDPIEMVSEIPSEAIRKYHKQNLNLALEKIDLVPVPLRQFQSVSIPLQPMQMKKYQEMIDDFLNRVSEFSEQNPGSEVYHVNVQLFPVTQVTKENS